MARNPEIDEILSKGSEYIKKQDYDKAEVWLADALEKKPKVASLYNNLGMVKLLKKEADAAIPLLEKAIELDPRILDAYQNLGSCYFYKGEFEKAEEIYLKALQFDSLNKNTYHNLSTLYLQTEQLSKARKSLEKLLQFDPQNLNASFTLGMVCYTSKDYYPAMANFLYALYLNNDFNDARLALSDTYTKMGRYQAALHILNEVAVRTTNLITPYVKAAIIHIELREPDKAVPYLEKAIEIDNANLEVMEMLAILYEQISDKERAEELYHEILTLEPEHKSAGEGLERLEKIEADFNTANLFQEGKGLFS